MPSLLLDTSDRLLVVALAGGGTILDQTVEEAWQRQSELLVPRIHELLERNGIYPKEIESVVCSKGPGSYTGVRVALTVAKVLAFDLSIPLHLVSSLEVLRKPGKTSLCLMNARAGRSYLGAYSPSGENLIPDRIVQNVEIEGIRESLGNPSLCGDLSYLGLEGHRSDIPTNLLLAFREDTLEKEVLSAKPVYLKETYLR